jgi:small ligand-binding sensory domain FIST
MTPFPHAHAAADDWREALAQIIESLGGLPAPELGMSRLGFVYVTDPLTPHLDDVLQSLRDATGVEHWVGAVGIGICATGVETYEQPAVAAMIAELPENSFRVFTSVTEDLADYDALQERWLGNAEPFLGLVHGDPANTETEGLIEQLAARTATGFLVGGLASAHGEARTIADGITSGGVSGVMFTDAVGIQTNLSQGCSPIGPHRAITESQRNMLVTPRRPPGAGRVQGGHRRGAGGGPRRASAAIIFAGLPIPGSDTGDYLVRNLIGIDTTQKLIAIGDLVEQGQELMFCRRDAATAREDLARMLAHLRECKIRWNRWPRRRRAGRGRPRPGAGCAPAAAP